MYIWAPWKLEELKNRRGLFEVENKLGEKLLKEGLVEDPKIGGNRLTKVTDDPAPRKKTRKKKAESAENKAIEPEQTTMIDADDIDVATD